MSAEEIVKLDSLDKKLLYHLDHGGRLSCSELARLVRQGRDRVEYRMQRFEELGVISGYHAVVNPYRFGLTLFKNYIRLSNDRERIKRFIAQIKKEQRVYWIAECSGSWDLIFSIAAESVFEFAAYQQNILKVIADLIIDISVYPVIVFNFFRLKYLHQSGTHTILIGGKPVKSDLDLVDRKILKLLALDARKPVVELASECDVAPITAQNRIDRLKKDGVITGFKAEINFAALGMSLFKAMIFQREINLKEESRLYDFSNKHPNITESISQIGNCRREIELHVKNYSHYNQIIDELRSRFQSLIYNVEPLVIHKEYYQWGLQP
jgi:Lrp/AsnC family leucine-responsive transcriptional regulator